jgi:hypothetical protein
MFDIGDRVTHPKTPVSKAIPSQQLLRQSIIGPRKGMGEWQNESAKGWRGKRTWKTER